MIRQVVWSELVGESLSLISIRFGPKRGYVQGTSLPGRLSSDDTSLRIR